MTKMTISVLITFLIIGVPVGTFVLVGVLLWRMRKARWREAAMLMGAQYSGEKFFRCGTIQGERNGRSFKVEIRKIRHSGSGEYAYTWITAPLLNKGVILHFPPAFFDKGCNPAEAFKKTPFVEDVRVFVTTIQVDRIKTDALVPEEQAQLATALKGWNPGLSPIGNPVGKEGVTVESQEVVFSEVRVVKDVRRIEALVDLVTELAKRIEENPVEE